MFYNLHWPDAELGPFSYGEAGWVSKFRPAEWSERVHLEGIKCPRFPGHQRGGDRIGDLDVVLPSPRIGDFSWTWISECIITEPVLSSFRAAEFTGFDVRPVTVSRTKRVPKGTQVQIPTLWELVVTGRGGDAAPESGIRLFYQCDACGMKEYSSFRNGIIVDDAQWDGSDFFTVNGYPRFILVTERVADIIAANELTNCALVPSQELRWGQTIRPEDVNYCR